MIEKRGHLSPPLQLENDKSHLNNTMIVRELLLVGIVISQLTGSQASCAIGDGGSAIYMNVDENHPVGELCNLRTKCNLRI